MRLVSQAELVYCSFDEHFIDRIAEDIKTLRLERLVFRPALRDRSIHLLMQMLVSEFDAGNPTGRVYAETLAEALALRFLHLGTVAPIDTTLGSANNVLYVWDMTTPVPELFDKLDLGSSAFFAQDQRNAQLTKWLAWLGPENLSVASANGMILVIGLDETRWRTRIHNLDLGPAN